MAKGEDKNRKFKVKADLALFETIQRDGRLSEEKIAQKVNISSTTVHYSMERIRKRGFFQIKAVPILEKFQEIPLAIIGFSNVHPMKVKKLKDTYAGKQEIIHFFHDDKDVILVVMDSSDSSLTRNLFDIMELLNEKPCIYIKSPTIVKSDTAIPDEILEAVYADLPDRRIRV